MYIRELLVRLGLYLCTVFGAKVYECEPGDAVDESLRLAHELKLVKGELVLAKQAVKAAAEFARKRLPRDMRENTLPEGQVALYFESVFYDVAKVHAAQEEALDVICG